MNTWCCDRRWRELMAAVVVGRFAGCLVGATLAASVAWGQELLPPVPGAGQADNAPEVLEQGPVHEAFAEPVPLAVPQSIEVDQAPPAPIDEVPPDVKPEGDQVEWIPGYWQWSDDRRQFIWVSGVWRKIPPGRQWVPGYWSERAGKYVWVPGFWSDAQAARINYLPAPPDSLDLGPTGPAPGDNYFWIPGCWLHRNQRYVWRPGFWHVGANNWVWVPSHYRYTPAGAVFVVGYWDFLPQYRGMLFAPVCWSSPIYLTAGYQYRPRLILDTSSMLDILYVNSRCGLYYFGRGNWQSELYTPWYVSGRHRQCYDPLYVYHSWNHPGRPDNWTARYQRVFDERHREFGHREFGNRELVQRERNRQEPGQRDIGSGPGTEVVDRPTVEPDAKPRRPDWIREASETRQVGSRAVRRFSDDERQQVRRQSEKWRAFQDERRNRETLATKPESKTELSSGLVQSPSPGDGSSDGRQAPDRRLEGRRSLDRPRELRLPGELRPADQRVSNEPLPQVGPNVEQDDPRRRAEELLRRNQFRSESRTPGRTPGRSLGRSLRPPTPVDVQRQTESSDVAPPAANSPTVSSPAENPAIVVNPPIIDSPIVNRPVTGPESPVQGPATVDSPATRRGRQPLDIRPRDTAGANPGRPDRPSGDEFRRQLRELRQQNERQLGREPRELGNLNQGRNGALGANRAEPAGIPGNVGPADLGNRVIPSQRLEAPHAPEMPQREIPRGQRSRGEVRRMMDLERSRPSEPSSRSIPNGPSLPSGMERGLRGDSRNAEVFRRQIESVDRGNRGRGTSDGSELRGLQRGNDGERRRGSKSR